MDAMGLTAEAVQAALLQVDKANDRPAEEILALKESIVTNPHALDKVVQSDPKMAEALMSDDPNAFVEHVREKDREHRRRQAEHQQYMLRLERDPFDKEAQEKIEEIIHQNNVHRNYEHAMEHTPEVFGSVHMLYVNSEVNGVKLKAFVDCGAQMTIMTVATAERCGLMRLVDTRYSGLAKGVGTAKIVGRVHVSQLKIGETTFPCSFTILEQGGHDFLLGLDMLRRFQCHIDLKEGCLRIGDEVAPFLSEGDVPSDDRVGAGNTDGEEDEQTAEALKRSRTETEQQEAADIEATKRQSLHTDAATPAATPVPAAAAPTPAPTRVSAGASASDLEAGVAQLSTLGFNGEQALAALNACDGNVEQAASFLMAAFDR